MGVILTVGEAVEEDKEEDEDEEESGCCEEVRDDDDVPAGLGKGVCDFVIPSALRIDGGRISERERVKWEEGGVGGETEVDEEEEEEEEGGGGRGGEESVVLNEVNSATRDSVSVTKSSAYL